MVGSLIGIHRESRSGSYCMAIKGSLIGIHGESRNGSYCMAINFGRQTPY